MRNGPTDSTLVVADAPVGAPPIVSRAWSAIAMHDKFWAPIAPKLRPGGVVLVNEATFETALDEDALNVFRVPATEVAASLGNELGGSMVMVGAYVGLTGLVGVDAVVEGMRESIPAYRQQHIGANEAAIRAGYELVEPDRLAVPA
jgi:2-oxoglutarate ferredoxin oxidoreductase subunit gamma